jgi:imidazolonepropionase-like amidohydrolase
MKTRTTIIMTTLAVALTGATATAQTIAIENATIHTEPGKKIENATIVIRNGRIRAVGKKVVIPAGATRIDGKGKQVTAGLVETSSRLGLVEVDLVRSTNEGSFKPGKTTRAAVHAAYRVTDGYNPRSIAIPIARTGGITSAVVTPTGGLVSGTSAWVSLADRVGKTTVKTPAAMYVTLGRNSRASAAGSRGLAIKRLRELLDDALLYARRKAAFDRNQSRKLAANRLDLAALIPVARGRVPLVARVHRAADIRAILRVATRRKLRLVIEGGTEAWMLAKELAAAKVPVILDPTSNLPGSFDRIHVRNDAAKRLAAAGVDVAVSTLGDWPNTRTLRQRAGVAVAYGLPWKDALAAVTTIPAKIFGIKDRGRIKVGAVADVVVWSGDPLELSTRATHVLVNGREQSLQTRQTRLFQRYRVLQKR